MPRQKNNNDFTNGLPELLILKLLDQREMYGYEIVRGIKLISQEQFEYGEGVIYPLLHAMQRQRLLAVRKEEVNSRPRIYYRLTKTGRAKLQYKLSQWSIISNAIHTVLSKKEHDNESP